MTPVFVPDELCRLLDSAPDPIVLVDAAGRIAFVNVRAETVFGCTRAELVGRPTEVLIPEWVRVERLGRTGAGVSGPQAHPPGEALTPSVRRPDRTEFPVRSDGRIDDRIVLVLVADPSFGAGGVELPPQRGDPVREAAPLPGESPVVQLSRPARQEAGSTGQPEPRHLHRDGHVLWELMTVYPTTRSADGPAQLHLGPFRAVTVRTGAGDEARHSAARFRALFEATTAGMVEMAPDGRFLMANGAFCRMMGYTPAELIEMTVADVLFPEDRAHVLTQFGEVAAGRVHAYEADRRYRRKDSSALWARVSVRARDGVGEPTGAFAVVIDQTDRKHLEARLQRAQKGEAVGLRASGLAHDFNNLLTIISGCAGILLEGIPNAGPTRDLVLELTTACQRAAGLTAQLLAFGRATTFEPRVLDLNEVVAQSIRLLRRLLGPDITLVADLSDPSDVRADLMQLEQVILNLVINAKDAMPRGGMLTIETHGIRVRDPDRSAYPDLAPGEYVQLAVSDTGVGMTDEVKARAFEPFFTTKDVGKGSGLGLAAVHGAVTQCGGRVDVYSELGVGTIFEILLPAIHPAPTGSVRLVPRGAETVLLVETESATRKLARLALQAHGYGVLEAPGGAEALQLGREHTGPIELLLVGVGGRELADALRLRHPKIKVLYLGGGVAGAASRPGDATAPVIQKPFTPLSLAHKVRAVLDGTI